MSGTSPSTAFRPPHERGNSSYQALKRALTRSTSMMIGFSRLDEPSRACASCIDWKSSGPSATSNFCWIGASASLRTSSAACSDFFASPLHVARAFSMNRTPSATSLERSSSRSASTLRRSSSCQVAQRSVQASMLHCHAPVVPTVNSPAQRTPLRWPSSERIGTSSHLRPPGAL